MEKLKQGKYWFLFLIAIQTLVAILYILSHVFFHGKEVKTLSTNQYQNLSLVVADYNSSTDSIEKASRSERDTRIICFLKTSFEEDSIVPLNSIFNCLSSVKTKDVMSFFKDQEFNVSSYFWFKGYQSFLEVLLWSLVGVLLSLIYYVSLSNKAKEKDNDNPDLPHTFEYKEIYDHVAKMVYAPICTLVLILSYTYISSDNSVANVSAGKGMLVFSFIAGFYSGRVMKFLDKLKELLLPTGGTDKSGGSSVTPAKPLPPQAPIITDNTAFTLNTGQLGGDAPTDFKNLTISLTKVSSEASEQIPLEWNDEQKHYLAKQKLSSGKYKVIAELVDENQSVIKEYGAIDIEIVDTTATKEYEIILNKI
ncbi:MAG: hypothetical protein JNL95_00030 [Chitinophagales bacterium]|nr:hypothetical protein [Chitinophagales bacterium]